MDQEEARALLLDYLQRYAQMPFAELRGKVDRDLGVRKVQAPSGTAYNIQVDVFWEQRPGGPIRVIGAIDDGSAGALTVPVSEDLLRES